MHRMETDIEDSDVLCPYGLRDQLQETSFDRRCIWLQHGCAQGGTLNSLEIRTWSTARGFRVYARKWKLLSWVHRKMDKAASRSLSSYAASSDPMVAFVRILNNLEVSAQQDVPRDVPRLPWRRHNKDTGSSHAPTQDVVGEPYG